MIVVTIPNVQPGLFDLYGIGAVSPLQLTQIKRPGVTTYSPQVQQNILRSRQQSQVYYPQVQQQVPQQNIINTRTRPIPGAAYARLARSQTNRALAIHRQAARARNKYWTERERLEREALSIRFRARQLREATAKEARLARKTHRESRERQRLERYANKLPESMMTIQPMFPAGRPSSVSQQQQVPALQRQPPSLAETERLLSARERLGIEGIYY